MKSLAILAVLAVSAQVGAATSSYYDSLNVKSLHNEEVANEVKGVAPRFAVPHSVSIKPQWEASAAGYTWTHTVTAPNATSLNFGFTSFRLPASAKVEIYSADHSQFIRSFTAADNNVNGALWTPIIEADDVVIEVTVAANEVNDVALELGHIGQGFRTFGETTQKSGSCNVDVACTESKGWEKEVNSVGVISTGGSTFCTGFMVNNTANDKTPYFMTANHCRITASSAPSLVVYWNYQTSVCKGPRDGKKTDFQTGSTFLSSYAKSDFTLVKLNTVPNPEWNVNFAGWDATESIGSPATGIHQPNTDEKAISFENDPTVLASYGGQTSPGDSTHVRITDWDVGTTEPGSSGSPLFDQNHRVIGQLHGGGAACGNDLSDYYGRFYTSWIGNGTKTTSLKEHLDPGKTGKLTVDTI